MMAHIKHKKSSSVSDTVNLKDLHGARVLSKSGKLVGHVTSFHIHPKKLVIEGITLEETVFSHHYVTKKYIDSITSEGVKLNIIPFTEYIGLPVYDRSKKHVGTVKEVRRKAKTNDYSSLVIDTGLLKKSRIVKKKDIASIKDSVKLKISL